EIVSILTDVCTTRRGGTVTAPFAFVRDAHLDGAAHMTQMSSSGRGLPSRGLSKFAFAGGLLLTTSIFSAAEAQSLGYAPAEPGAGGGGRVFAGLCERRRRAVRRGQPHAGTAAPPGRRARHTRGAGHRHHRYRQHLSLLRARRRTCDPLRRRRRPGGFYLGRR